MSYVPPHLRNKPQASNGSQASPNPFKKERRPPRRPHEKSSWEVQKEQAEREAEKNIKRGLENTEENFPVLGNTVSTSTSTAWNTSGRKFSELVSDWKNDDDERREQEEPEKDSVRKENKEVFVLPVFRNTKRFSDLDDKSPKEDEDKKIASLDDGWTNVDKRKYRKPKAERTSEEESANEPKEEPEDDTVWAAPEEHETCWDDRRY